MKCKGKIKNLSQFVVSDPHYLKDVWCRYDKEFCNVTDWNVEILIKDVNEKQEYKGMEFDLIGLDFSILLKRENLDCNLIDIGKIAYIGNMQFKDTKIGIDTAQISMGTNEKAVEINKYAKEINKENAVENLLSEYNPYFAIQTMSDGVLGTVREGNLNNETSFILVTGFFDEYACVDSKEELKDYIVKQLNIEELQIEKNYGKIRDVDYEI